MGLFAKLKQYNEEHKSNVLYELIKKQLVADGKEHILQKGVSAIVGNKTIGEFPEFMATQGFEVIDLDVLPHANQGMKQIKIKYRSTD